MRLFTYILILFTLINQGFSQDLFNNGAIISIKENTVLSTGFSFNNKGSIINNGSLVVGGSWNNENSYADPEGVMTLNGEQEQNVDHGGQLMSRLVIDGGGTKVLEHDLVITESITLTEGVIRTSDDVNLIFENGAEINGGSDESFISGPIVHRGNGNKLYPLGLNDLFLPAELIDVAGTEPEIRLSVTIPNDNMSIDGSLNDVSSNQLWELEVMSGIFSGARVSLAVRDEAILNNIAEAVVAQADPSDDTFGSLGHAAFAGDLNNGMVTSDKIGRGPFFTIGSAPLVSTENDVTVITALSPNGDGIHDFLKILNIGAFPDNHLTVFNRWGDRVFEAIGYDNVSNVFEGFANVNGNYELTDGTYYYVLNKNDGSKSKSGFIEIRR